MLSSVDGSVTLSSAVHSQNALYPILVTPSGIVISESDMQLSNAYFPILSSVDGSVTLVSPSHL